MKRELIVLYLGRESKNGEGLSSHPEVQVRHCTNMLEAIKYMLSEPKPDAVLSEYYISGGSGIEFHEWLRERADFDNVAFILLSHEFRSEYIRNAFATRMDDFFVLPLPTIDSLIGRIRFLSEYRNKYSITTYNSIKPQDQQYVMPFSKRAFDLFVAVSALICLSPLLFLVMLAIRLESKGKVYYTSKRVGREPFDFYKLRSMRLGADKELKNLAKEKNQYAISSDLTEIDFYQPCPLCSSLPEGKKCSPILHIGSHNICDYWYNMQKRELAKTRSAFIKISDDPRITKVGRFIRNTSIDELPQLINVIKGNMSIVGNRPLPVYEAELLTRGLVSKRFLAPAGITGLWQVELRGKGGVMSEEERMRLDNEYADHFIGDKYSFWYDLKLILRTVPALFQKDTV